MTITKELIPTKAKLEDADISKYIVVPPNTFVYNPRTHGKHIGFGFNDTMRSVLISWNNAAFRISPAKRGELDARYLFLHFSRDEWDREACFCSWGSSTEVFSWNALCDMQIYLQPIEVQRKYVAIYEAMLANQRAYEKGLDDLKLTCDALLDRCKKSKTWEPVGNYLREVDVRNFDGKCDVAYGVNIKKELMLSKASSDDLLKYKLVKPGQIACNLLHVGRDASYPIAVNETDSCIAVSPAYSVFMASNTDMAVFLMAWFSRAEIGRNGWFICDDSIRGSMAIDRFLSCEMPIPDGETIKAIAELRRAYWTRARINARLIAQLKDLCPILIRGSVEEASR